MQVLAAPDGEAAWNLLLQNLDAVRAVVTDIEMPQLNGLQLAHRIRVDQRTAQLPVIAVSSLAGEEDIARGKAAGVSEYQFKLDREKLLASVHAYLGR
jgi:two-component system chemotaxis sensor kinase CheA